MTNLAHLFRAADVQLAQDQKLPEPGQVVLQVRDPEGLRVQGPVFVCTPNPAQSRVRLFTRPQSHGTLWIQQLMINNR